MKRTNERTFVQERSPLLRGHYLGVSCLATGICSPRIVVVVTYMVAPTISCGRHGPRKREIESVCPLIDPECCNFAVEKIDLFDCAITARNRNGTKSGRETKTNGEVFNPFDVRFTWARSAQSLLHMIRNRTANIFHLPKTATTQHNIYIFIQRYVQHNNFSWFFALVSTLNHWSNDNIFNEQHMWRIRNALRPRWSFSTNCCCK